MTMSKMKCISFVAVLAFGVGCSAVAAAERQQNMQAVNSIYDYGPNGPNRSYQVGPHTRIYVTKRSWLDGGTEVLPEERSYTDYAFPPGYSLARENNDRPLDRQPLNPSADLGGYSDEIPLY